MADRPPTSKGHVATAHPTVRRSPPYEQDATAARVLAGGADRDVTEIRAEIRDFRQATTSAFNAMRADFTDLREHVNNGFAEIRGRLDAAAAGQQQIVSLLNTLIDQDGQGMQAMATLERTRNIGTRPYPLRGRIRCGICTRRMQAATIRDHITYYRCLARTLAPGSTALADHPRTVNLREDALLDPLNAWIGGLFDRTNVDRTVAALVASQDGEQGGKGAREAVKKRLKDAETRLRRLQAAIESGIDPAALVEAVNTAQAQRAAARAELEGTPAPSTLTEAEVYAMIDSLGDVGTALSGGRPDSLCRLYQALRLELRYLPHERAVEVTASPRVVSECVRGGT